jgi:hypothetical protein
MTAPTCPCGKPAITTIVQIPACSDCHEQYAIEGRKLLLMHERAFFKSFIDHARKAGYEKATAYCFSGY